MNARLLVAVLLASCGGSSAGEDVVTPLDALLVLPLSVNLEAGEKAQLSAQRFKAGASTDFTASATWSSSATSVVTVEAGGLVTALKPGRAVLTGNADGATATAQVVVSAPPFQVMPRSVHLHVRHLEDGGAEVESKQLLARTWANDVATEVTGLTVWGSSNTSVAWVNDAGVVTAVDVGQATLTGLFEGGTATLELNVGDAHDE